MYKNHRKGSRAEYIAAAHFAKEGWEVYWSPNNLGAADFIVSRGSTNLRVQVKYAGLWTRGSKVYQRVSLSKSNGELYEPTDYDVLAAVGEGEDLWIIPYRDLPKTKTLYLHRDDGEGGNVYEWEKYKVKYDVS